ncbi:MAG: Gx transporter family protein [Bacilli bacterium]|nr:Gx transporter family protein [Bacilli bacterium]
MHNTHKISLIAVLTAAAIVISIIESFIPSVGIPGIKLGLANILILVTLYELGPKEALLVNILRVYLSNLLRGSIMGMGFVMSLSGALLSYLVMLLFYLLIKKFSIIGVSVLGSIAHIVGQILVAMAYLGTSLVIYYLPFIAISALITGIFVGIVAKAIIKTGIIKKQRNKYNF